MNATTPRQADQEGGPGPRPGLHPPHPAASPCRWPARCQVSRTGQLPFRHAGARVWPGAPRLGVVAAGFPNSQGRECRRGGGRAEVCRRRLRVSPRKPQKCPRPQKEWNQFERPAPWPRPCLLALPPPRPRSLLPAWPPGPPAPALPLVEALLEAPSGQANFCRINRAERGFIVLAPLRREVSDKPEVAATTV